MNRDAIDMINELVARHGEAAKGIIASGLNLDIKNNRCKCPNVYGHKHGDKNPSMGWVRDKYYFNCLGCGETINIYSYYKNYLNYSFSEIMEENGVEDLSEKRNNFIKNANKDKSKLTQDQKDYLDTRGLTSDTIRYFKLINISNSIAIPYFKNNLLIGIKKRLLNTTGSKNLSVEGSKFFLFNSDSVEFDQSLIVTEGEWDTMILHQLGYKNTVSVGCGANSLNNLFEQSEDFFEKFHEIILFTDNDKSGNSMDKSFIDKFGAKIATVDKSFYLDCKDANDIFLKYGEDQIRKIIKSGKARFDGEWDLEDDPYINLNPKDIKFIKTGISTLDYAINTIQSKMVTLITGRSNAGKSTFVNQIISSAINQNFKVYLALGEGNKDKIINRFYTGLIGGNSEYFDYSDFGLRKIKEPKSNVLKAIQKWHKNKLKLWVKSLSKYKTDTEMFEMLEYKIRTEKYDLVVLDNQMSLLSVSRASDKNEAQSLFVERCHHLAMSTNCAIILVLHPNKTYRKGEEMDFEQISGTSDISNKADIILSVIRIPDKDIENSITSKIQVVKNRDESELPTIDCFFDKETYTFAEIKDNKILPKSNIGWKKYLPKTISEGQINDNWIEEAMKNGNN